VVHGRPSMMLGAGNPRLRCYDTISLRDDRLTRYLPSLLPHLRVWDCYRVAPLGMSAAGIER
jgi:hypothetical protein